MSQPPPPASGSDPDPQIPSPPPPAPPPGYYADGAAQPQPGGAPSAEYTAPARWRSLRGLTTALAWLFSAHIVLTVVLIFGVLNHLRVLGDEEVNGVIPVVPDDRHIDRINDANALPAAMILLSGLVFVAIFVLLIIWLYRAAKNNEALGRQNPRLGPGWAIGGWFIPIAWWVIPFIILDDVWRGSDPSIARGDPNWRRSSTLGAIWAWLVTAAIFTIPSGIAIFTGDVRPDEPEKVRRDDILRIIGAVAAIAAAVLAILVTRRIAARQEECLQAQQATAPAT